MTARIKRYFRFWFWIDLVGLALSVILIISYLVCGYNFDEHIQNLWSNLAIEILGVWLSVRIIDFLLQRHKNFRDTRLQQLRILQYFYDTGINVLEYGVAYQRDIDSLKREIKYFDKRWLRRKKHFYKDEIEQIDQLRQSMPEIVDKSVLIKRSDEKQDSYSAKPFNEQQDQERADLRKEHIELKNLLRNCLSQYLERLENLRENIWEETHPDD